MKLQVKNGTFHYPKQERIVLKDLSFSVESGEILSILGPNGAGKTTLLRCTMGLMNWCSGQTLVDGRPLREIPRRTLWQNVSYVPQARQALATYTVEEMVLLGRTSHLSPFALPNRDDLDKTAQVIARLHLESIQKRPCSELSGGEFQMVLIARALASEPKVLILDEPESNLDFKNQLLVLDAMSQLAAEGMACLFNTHYPAHALRRASKALMLARDGSYQFGPTRDIVTEESIARVFGVQAVIGEVETPGNIYQDVVPVSVGGMPPLSEQPDGPVIAGITILAPDQKESARINELLHRYSRYLLGRMGLPNQRGGLNIIHLTLDAPMHKVQELTDQLNLLPGVRVKATYAAQSPQVSSAEEESS